jgi:hypothetical protein
MQGRDGERQVVDLGRTAHAYGCQNGDNLAPCEGQYALLAQGLAASVSGSERTVDT